MHPPSYIGVYFWVRLALWESQTQGVSLKKGCLGLHSHNSTRPGVVTAQVAIDCVYQAHGANTTITRIMMLILLALSTNGKTVMMRAAPKPHAIATNTQNAK
jgi:hypothetical protein